MKAGDYIAILNREPTGRSERVMKIADLARRRLGMAVAYESTTLLILAEPSIPISRLPDDQGAILGHVFERGDSRLLAGEDIISKDDFEAFVRSYWGGYVALRSRYATPEILRDPSGAVPSYHAAMDDCHLVVSRPGHLYDLGVKSVEFDWLVVSQALVYRDIKPNRTMLRGVAEILPGVAGRLYPTGFETRCVWSPWDFVRSPAQPGFEAAVDAVRSAVVQSTTALTATLRHPMLEISGGLDSAIVAASAARSGANAAFTFAPIEGDPDETPFAQAVADRIGARLAILPTKPGAIDFGKCASADLPRAYSRIFNVVLDDGAIDHAWQHEVDGFLSGGGGDNVFCYNQSVTPVLDRILSDWSLLGAIETVADLSLQTRTSLWRVGARTLNRFAFRRRRPWYRDLRLLDAASIQDLPFPIGHPWTVIPVDALPGKVDHVRLLIAVQNHTEGIPRSVAAPVVLPLLSQPVMEACLAIPTWLWCRGGNNRAVARAAFADMLPEPIVARRTKGNFDCLNSRLLEINGPSLRPLLLDGQLADQRLLDRQAVESALRGDDNALSVRLWQLADIEIWLRSWWARTPSGLATSVA